MQSTFEFAICNKKFSTGIYINHLGMMPASREVQGLYDVQ